MDTAYFTIYPKTVWSLSRPRLLNDAAPYAVVGTVTLDKPDYDNFAADLLVSRDFLEGRAADCGAGADGVIRCLRVVCEGGDSLLIVPDGDGTVEYAAAV